MEDTASHTRQTFTMSDKATTIDKIIRRCAPAAGIMAVALTAPAAAVAEGPAAVLASGKPNTLVDTQGASCPGAFYCIAPGPDPEVPYGTDPYTPYVDPVTRETGVLTGVCRMRMRPIRDLGHSAAGLGALSRRVGGRLLPTTDQLLPPELNL